MEEKVNVVAAVGERDFHSKYLPMTIKEGREKSPAAGQVDRYRLLLNSCRASLHRAEVKIKAKPVLLRSRL